jgi:hypothetical protein
MVASLPTQWFGKDVLVGPCLYYGAEDEADELHRRLETIVRHAGNTSEKHAGPFFPVEVSQSAQTGRRAIHSASSQSPQKKAPYESRFR